MTERVVVGYTHLDANEFQDREFFRENLVAVVNSIPEDMLSEIWDQLMRGHMMMEFSYEQKG